MHRSFLPRELDVGLEAPHLAAVRIAVDDEIGQPEMLAIEHDHPRAGAEDRFPGLADRLVQSVELRETHDRGRLAAGDHETVDAFELLREPHLDDVRAKPAQHLRVLAKRALQGKHTDPQRPFHERRV